MLIAEDHAILRKGLRQIVEGETGLKVIAEAEDGIQALELTRTCRPHVAVLDVDMPGKDGLTVAREVGLLRLDVALIPTRLAATRQITAIHPHARVTLADRDGQSFNQSAHQSAHRFVFLYDQQLHNASVRLRGGGARR